MTEQDHEQIVGGSEFWSSACPCLRCRWEAWWHEGDNSVIEMPKFAHPDGEYQEYFESRDLWSGVTHPND